MNTVLPPRQWARTITDKDGLAMWFNQKSYLVRNYFGVLTPDQTTNDFVLSGNHLNSVYTVITKLNIPNDEWIRLNNEYFFYTLEQALFFKLFINYETQRVVE